MRLAQVECNTQQLLDGTCQFDYNKLVGIKQDLGPEKANDPNLLVADIFLGATFFIGTIAFLGILVSGVRLIFQWWTDPKQSADAIKWIKYSLIGLTIVIFSYTIVRLIQYFVWGKV